MFSQFLNTIFVKRGCSRPQFASSVFSEVFDGNFTKVYFGKVHGLSINCGFGIGINFVNKNAHPLLSSSMRVDCTTSFAGCFDFNPIFSGLDRIARITTAHD